MDQADDRGRSRVVRAASYAANTLVVLPFAYHLSGRSDAYLAFPTDDFYYYAVVADHSVREGITTFDGLTRTNGFHPLYMLVLMVFRLLAGGLNPAFFALVAALALLAGCATFELYLRLGRALHPGSRLSAPLAAVAAFGTTRMATWGMEITLAMPLIAWLLTVVATTRKLAPKRAFSLGLLCAAIVLARLDAMNMALLLVVCMVGWGKEMGAREAKNAAAFVFGMLPIGIYLLYNQLLFGQLMPVSAVAKQLKRDPGFNFGFLGVIADTSVGRVFLLAIPVGCVLVALRGRRREQARGTTIAMVLALGFPIVYYVTFGLRSNWWLFRWYMYPIPLTIFVAVLLTEEALAVHLRWLMSTKAAWLEAACVSLALIVGAAKTAYAKTLRFVPDTSSFYVHGKRLAQETRGLEGRFAMGDRAGLTAFLLQKPVVQLEGIIADRAMVEHIRRQDDLREVLREYGVDYLIVTLYDPLEREGACYSVVTPHPRQSGQRSPRMTGRFCTEPIVELHTSGGQDPAPNAHTYVFASGERVGH